VENNQNKPQREIFGERMNFPIIGMLNINYLFIPCLWVLVFISSQQLDQICVHNFNPPISLRMEINGML
jgi:hypothetical protein